MKISTILGIVIINLLFTFQLKSINCAPSDCDKQTKATTNAKSSIEIEKDPETQIKEKEEDKDKEVVENPAATVAVNGSTVTTDVKRFIQVIQNTLEKAKPWVDEIEKEAKRLETTAKRFGEGVITRFGSLVDKIIGGNNDAVISANSFISSLISGAGGGGGHTGSATVSTESHIDAAASDVPNEDAVPAAVDASDNKNSLSSDNKIKHEATKPSLSTAAPNVQTDIIETLDDINNEIISHGGEDANNLINCPDGFVVDVNDICQRVAY